MTPNQLAVIAEVLRQIGPQKDAPRTERNRPGKPKHTPIEVPPPPDAMVQELADLIGEFGRHVPESLADVKTEDLDFYDIALAYGMKFRRSVIAGSRLWDAEWARAFHWFASKVKSVLENVRYQLGAEIADFQQHIIAPRLREAAMELNEDAVDLAAQFMMIALNGWDPARGNLRSYVRAWLLGGLVNFQNEAFAQSPYYRLLVQREQLLHADTAFHLCPKCRRTANYPHATECAQCHCAGEYFVEVAAEKIVAVNFESELALAAHGMAHSRSTAELQERKALHRDDSPCHAWLERRTRAGTDETWLYFETADERLSDREFTILVGETSHAVRLTPTSDGYAIASIPLDLPYAEAARLLPAGSFFQSAE